MKPGVNNFVIGPERAAALRTLASRLDRKLSSLVREGIDLVLARYARKRRPAPPPEPTDRAA